MLLILARLEMCVYNEGLCTIRQTFRPAGDDHEGEKRSETKQRAPSFEPCSRLVVSPSGPPRVPPRSLRSPAARSPLRDGCAFIFARVTHTSFALPARRSSTLTKTAGPPLVLAALSLSVAARATPQLHGGPAG